MEIDLRNIELLNYQSLLDNIDQENSHLLLGNGFNCSLGIFTTYQNIFERMKEISPDYKILDQEFIKSNSDIELVIGNVQNSINENNNYKNFLYNFLTNKIKADFMKATISIVNENIKNIYQDNKEGIYLLFSKFQNYFTLNYDPFLYLLLMKYKKKDATSIAFVNSFNFFQDDQKGLNSELFSIIDSAYNEGNITITLPNLEVKENLNRTTKANFLNQIKTLLKSKSIKFKSQELQKTMNQYLEHLNKKDNTLNVNDGFQGELFEALPDESLQNVFFIHGAFHIYRKGKEVRKITQTSEKALYHRIEEVIESEDQDIICVLKANEKETEIDQNNYLRNSLSKLSEIEGELVIFGSALSENDNHIFSRINDNDKITKVYLSTCPENLQSTSKRALEVFPNKEIVYFDYKTISYQKYEDIEYSEFGG